MKKGVAAIIPLRLIHRISSNTAYAVCESLVGI